MDSLTANDVDNRVECRPTPVSAGCGVGCSRVRVGPIEGEGMNVSATVWGVTLGAIALIFVLDVVIMGRRPRTVGIREAGLSVLFYVALSVVFGVGVWFAAGHAYGMEYFAGYVTELSLSVDNLFVFVVILSAFAVPRQHQLRVLQLGIIGALLLRFAFILIGAAALERFSWLFFLFGGFLLWTAWKLASEHGTEAEPEDNKVLRWVEKVLPTTTDYHGARFAVRLDGRRVFTPLAVVIIAVFLTDIMFALDSIPAIFGLTQETYLVITANAFALMGLRQMFFLLDGLLDRLIYLSLGLAVILGFVGIKLIAHASHEAGLDVPEISTGISLTVIVLTLAVTVIASLAKVRNAPEVYATHDVTGHHHPPGAALDELRAHGRHPQPASVEGVDQGP
jgi:tellurite resistance protein TerC